MATFAQICTNALEGVLDTNIPTTFFGNDDPTARIVKRAAIDISRMLVRDYYWQALKEEHTISTVDGVTGYDLPTDLQRIANGTVWSETDEWQLINVSDEGWRTLRSGITVSGIRYYFSVFNNKLNIDPAPGATSYDLIFDYYGDKYCTSAAGVNQSIWQADADTFRLDDNMLELGIRYLYLRRSSLPFEEEKAEFFNAIRGQQVDDRIHPTIDVGRTDGGRLTYNIPDGNWNI